MKFRPCIDLKDGRVVQIVGGTLRDGDAQRTVTNFETERSPADYARLYREDGFWGGHVIALGPGNEAAALEALAAFPGSASGWGYHAAQCGKIFARGREPCDCDVLCFPRWANRYDAIG